MKYKTLNAEAMIRNINGLSLGDKAYCGPYGTVKCYQSKSIHGARKFSVSGSSKLINRGGYTMSQLRNAICG